LPGNYGGTENGCIASPKDSVWERKIRKKLRDGALTYKDAKQRSKMPSRQFDFELDDRFREQCFAAIRNSNVNMSNRNKQLWEDAIRAGHVLAFLALLLSVLPNLGELFLGADHIFHYPVLFNDADPQLGVMAPWSADRRRWNNDTSTQQLKDHKYLAQVFQLLYPRLTKLEMPSSWTGTNLGRDWRISPTYQHFSNLQSLILPEFALTAYLTAKLPQSIEELIIVDCRLESFFHVISILGGIPTSPTVDLPNLGCISMYLNRMENRSPLLLNRSSREAERFGITFSHHCPKDSEVCAVDVGGQPWKMTVEELDNISALFSISSRENRALLKGGWKLAGHWVGKEMAKGYSPGSAKEYFGKSRNRRG
jgi:hypothetical protein